MRLSKAVRKRVAGEKRKKTTGNIYSGFLDSFTMFSNKVLEQKAMVT